MVVERWREWTDRDVQHRSAEERGQQLQAAVGATRGFKFGLHPSNTPEQAEAVPAIVENIVRSNDKLRFDRAHLQAIGRESLDSEVV